MKWNKYLWRGTDARYIQARYWRTDGILTKLIDGGNPAYLTQHGLEAAVRMHVHAPPGKALDQWVHDHTAFSSFTTSRATALHYATGGARRELFPWDGLNEDVVLFRLDVSGYREVAEGVATLDYDCDYARAKPIEHGLASMGTHKAVHCALHGRVGGPHKLLLIDAADYLEIHGDAASNGGAKAMAGADKEVLVLPADDIPDLGLSARIPPSQAWTAETFRFTDQVRQEWITRELGETK
jgi:hypothetical protein